MTEVHPKLPDLGTVEKHQILIPSTDDDSDKSKSDGDGDGDGDGEPQHHSNVQRSHVSTNLFRKIGNVGSKVANHFTSAIATDPGPPPDGGLHAWTQVALAWLVIMTTWGYMNSFGAFQTHYTGALSVTASTVSWIGSLQIWMIFFVSTFSGRALDAGLFTPTLIVGSVIQLVGIFTNSICTSFWQLLLAQGLCTGLGSGIIFCPTMGLVTTYFARRRGLAVAVVSTGNSFGGAIYPVMVRQLLPRLGFGWTVRVIAFINLMCLSLAIAFMRPRLPPRKSGPLVEWKAFTEVSYLLAVSGFALVFGSLFFVFYYTASYGRTVMHMSYNDSTTLVILLNAVGVPSRLLTGMVADRFTGPLNLIILLILINGILVLAWIGVRSTGALYAIVGIYGLAAGAFQSLFPTAITSLQNDLSKNGIRLGMAFSLFSFAGLVGPPIGGALITTYGPGRSGYRAAFVGVGVATTLGTVLLCIARVRKVGWALGIRC